MLCLLSQSNFSGGIGPHNIRCGHHMYAANYSEPIVYKKVIFTVIKVAHRCLTLEKTVFTSLDQSSFEESIKKSAMYVIPKYF